MKLIWEFRGPDAAMTAAHYHKHLKTFLERQQLQATEIGEEQGGDMLATVFLVLPETDSHTVRQVLRPYKVLPMEEEGISDQ